MSPGKERGRGKLLAVSTFHCPPSSHCKCVRARPRSVISLECRKTKVMTEVISVLIPRSETLFYLEKSERRREKRGPLFSEYACFPPPPFHRGSRRPSVYFATPCMSSDTISAQSSCHYPSPSALPPSPVHAHISPLVSRPLSSAMS